MVRDPWTFAMAFVFGFIAWFVFVSPQKSSLRPETSHSLSAEPDSRLISERSPYMRTER
jgi:hypothetical protein